MDFRRERVRLETERHRIEGVLTLARDGYRSRVSDVLNASERDFLTLTEVTVAPLDGGPIELHPYLTVARRHIVFAVAGSEEPQDTILKGSLRNACEPVRVSRCSRCRAPLPA